MYFLWVSHCGSKRCFFHAFPFYFTVGMCKVYYCIVDFFKAFDIVPWHLAYKIKDLCLPPLDVLSLEMALFETIVDKVWMKTSDIEEFWSTIEVKHCYPLSPTFFVLYIDQKLSLFPETFYAEKLSCYFSLHPPSHFLS